MFLLSRTGGSRPAPASARFPQAESYKLVGTGGVRRCRDATPPYPPEHQIGRAAMRRTTPKTTGARAGRANRDLGFDVLAVEPTRPGPAHDPAPQTALLAEEPDDAADEDEDEDEEEEEVAREP